MSQRIQHDSPKKNKFIGAVLAGNTIKEAANTHNIPQSTASDIWHKYKKTGSTHNLPRSGCPNKVTTHTSRAITRLAKQNHRKPYHKIGKSVVPRVSASSV
jgi:transposase